MLLIEIFKKNIVSAASLVTSLGVVVAGWATLNNTYVHAEEYKREQMTQVQAIKDLRRDTTIQFEQYQLQSIDDKIFYLEQKTKPTDQDKALLNRYNRQRGDVIQRLQTLTK
jgi:uncharacterized membrane protein